MIERQALRVCHLSERMALLRQSLRCLAAQRISSGTSLSRKPTWASPWQSLYALRSLRRLLQSCWLSEGSPNSQARLRSSSVSSCNEDRTHIEG